MDKKSMTTIELKKINKNKVYKYIYDNKSTCKLDIAKDLQMGLSTVNHNLKELELEGLVQKNGFFNSTGGRKADAIEIVENAKISIGIAILENQIHFVAANLKSAIICKEAINSKYYPDDIYYEQLSKKLYDFIEKNNIDNNSILGVSIATQGIISQDGKTVSYGKILNNTSMNLDKFKTYINYECRLEHDSKAAANLELFRNPTVNDGVVFLINNNLGGAIINDKKITQGLHMRSGIIEHIHVVDNDELCYCGKKGCLETVCSINSLEKKSNLKITDFFNQLDSNKELQDIWKYYLDVLSNAISNLSLVIDGHYIISGYLSSFIKDSDVSYIINKINEITTFPITVDSIIISDSGKYTQALGGSLYYIERFINSI